MPAILQASNFLSKKEYESQVMPWKAIGDFFSSSSESM
jgi:hypothetical protein